MLYYTALGAYFVLDSKYSAPHLMNSKIRGRIGKSKVKMISEDLLVALLVEQKEILPVVFNGSKGHIKWKLPVV